MGDGDGFERAGAIGLALASLTIACDPKAAPTGRELEGGAESPRRNVAHRDVDASSGPAVPRDASDAGAVECPPRPAPVPEALDLDPFYGQYVAAGPIPIVGSDRVDPRALGVAWAIVVTMTAQRPDLVDALAGARARVAILATTEVTTDIPEYARLSEAFPGIDWDRDRRGLGATVEIPVASVGEENLLGLDDDAYRGESILVHEWSHATLALGVSALPDSAQRLRNVDAAFEAARAARLWLDTYAGTAPAEYFAEGTQSWFDVNAWADPPDGRHNRVNTRAALWLYDASLAELVQQTYPMAPPLSLELLSALARGSDCPLWLAQWATENR